MHALHLCAVANINAGRADHDALLAGDAVAVSGGLALLDGLAAMQRAALLAPLVVVSDDDCVLVQQRGLETPVRADKGTGLLAEAGKYGVEHQRKKDHGR